VALLGARPSTRRKSVQILEVLRGVLGQLTGVVLDLVAGTKKIFFQKIEKENIK
jgi:hypothetical protein